MGMTRAASFALRKTLSHFYTLQKRSSRRKTGGSPARLTARRGNIFASFGGSDALGSSCSGMSTESDFAGMRRPSTPSLPPRAASSSVCGGDEEEDTPIRPRRVGAAEDFGGLGRGAAAFEGLLGRPGEVGGRARRAELTECALRLCVERGGTTCACGERVLVMVTVTERGSPAK